MNKIRIVNDIIEFKKNNFKNIHIYFDKNNFTQIYALIIGPKNTPYYGGSFFFDIKFPDNYPNSPPKVKYLTTDGKVRFHPNLYHNGKVCLSNLNTWSGPPWTPVMNLTSILLSIEAVLTEMPIKNEPGYENIKNDDITSISFNTYVLYNTYKLAIINIINNNFNPFSNKNILPHFKDIIMENFNNIKKDLENNLLTYKEIYGVYPYNYGVYYTEDKSDLNFITLLDLFQTTLKILNKN
uniref:Ubiquitin-conjugating enzyme E2 Z n=1 Tax=viral metagenome TaxID=1070528 RepID=A0A6C0J9B3_9ZZZZ